MEEGRENIFDQKMKEREREKEGERERDNQVVGVFILSPFPSSFRAHDP